MKMKTVASCSPLLLCLVAGAARADLEPFSFDASESIKHHSNVLHEDESHRTADWLSTTEFKAALDQAISREHLKGLATVDLDHYAKLHTLSSVGYSASGEFDWSTIGDLSGALGADTRRHQYLDSGDVQRTSTAKNLQTDNHAFASVQLGGLARWSIFTGFDASERKYSDPTFDGDEVRQWAVSGGTNYSTSPDLSFGLHGRYVRGKYPKADDQSFSVKTLGVNTKWTISGNTSFDGNVGYTQQRTDGQPDQHYVNGAANWRWTPPSHFTVTLGATRDSNTNVGNGATIANANNSVTGRSLNTTAHLDVSYALTAKVTLDALAEYIHRKYSDARVPNGLSFGGVTLFDLANGTSNTSRFTLSAHYLPTRTTSVGCGYAREVHSADQSISGLFKPYTDNMVMCTAAIHFD